MSSSSSTSSNSATGIESAIEQTIINQVENIQATSSSIINNQDSEKMDTTADNANTTTTSNPQPPLPPPAQTVSTAPFQPIIVSYSKLLRPLFNVSSKLGRSLCELFGLLVKLSAGSWKNTNTRRNMIPAP